MQIICLLSNSRRLYVFIFHFFFQVIIQRAPFEQHTKKAVFGTVRTEAYRRYILAVYTAGITGTGHFGKVGTTSIPVPDTSVSSVRHPYRYREYRYPTEHTHPWKVPSTCTKKKKKKIFFKIRETCENFMKTRSRSAKICEI